MNSRRIIAKRRIKEMLDGVTESDERISSLRFQFPTISEQYTAIILLAAGGYLNEVFSDKSVAVDSVAVYRRLIDYAHAANDFEVQGLNALALKQPNHADYYGVN